MGILSINSLAQAEELESTGFSHKQAKLLLEIIAMNTTVNYANLTTKQDLALAQAVLKQDIADVRTELKQDIADLRTELKQDIADLRTELKQDIADLRTEFKQDIADIKQELSDFKIEFFRVTNYLDKKILQMTIALGAVMVASTSIISALIVLK